MELKLESAIAFAIFLASYITRVHRIEKGNFVTWDEAHFGKYALKYLSRTFYFDVHPPLGKILTALAGMIAGQPLDFDFSNSGRFPENFDYVGMRRFHAAIASFTPVFGYLITRELGTSLGMATMLSSLFIFENGSISIGRLVLLDSHLLTLTAASIYFFIRVFTRGKAVEITDRGQCKKGYCEKLISNMHNGKLVKDHDVNLMASDHINNENNTNSNTASYKPKAMSTPQKILVVEDTRDLIALGILIGCVMSVKWIGMLTTLQIGLYIAFDLFKRLKKHSFRHTVICFFRRAVFLIGLPTAIYLIMFWIHLKIVYKSGPDDGFMSPGFQSTLEGGATNGAKRFVSYGKRVTIRGQKGHLHSHMHTYPGEILENGAPLQVTMYEPRDSNNNFFFQKITENDEAGFLKNGDEVALLHAETNSYLEEGPEYTPDDEEYQFRKPRRAQMSRSGIGSNAVWIVDAPGVVESLSMSFALQNVESGWYLCWMGRQYPEWGYGQWEVGLVPEKTPNCMFTISENYFSDGEINTNVKVGFFSRFIELQKVMFTVNGSFLTNPDLEPDAIVSQPWEWPLLLRGLRMSQWHNHEKFYMFMNPLIHYGSTLGLVISPIIWVIMRIRKSRAGLRENDYENGPGPLFISIGGWLAHFLPFFMVGRVLYLHHYFPALFFAILNLAFLLRMLKPWIVSSFVIMCIAVYVAYSPLTYGFVDQNAMKKLQLIKGWNFVDQ